MSENGTTQKYNQTLDAWLDLAEALLQSGAEVWRVESTLKRIAKAYGAKKINAFTINSNISITCEFADGTILAQSRRVGASAGTDMEKLEEINTLSREYCDSVMDDDELRMRLKGIHSRKAGAEYFIGAALAAAAFSIFFGGSALDALMAALAGLLVCLFNRKLAGFFPNSFLSNFVISFLTGLLIYLSAHLIPSLKADKAIIGTIMLLIPGIAISNSIRDVIIGDTISGTTKFIECLFQTVGMAIGYIAAMLVAGGVR